MIIIDTNVVSEVMRFQCDCGVLAWFGNQDCASLFITSITEAELRYGVETLPGGRRKEQLHDALSGMLLENFAGRILPFDTAGAIAYAAIVAKRQKAGRPIGRFDALIAAIAKSRGASVATRNVADFEQCGIDVIDPWLTET